MMPSNDESAAAIADIISNIAKQYDPRDEQSFPGQVAANGTKGAKFSLPGPDTAEKRLLEQELAALVTRVQFLESKAANSSSFPITLSEPNQLPPAYPTD